MSAPSDPYPEQKHAGLVGLGPNYHPEPTLGDKIQGLKEELKGTIKHDPDLVKHGHQVKSGEERRKKLSGEDQPNPFAAASEGQDTDHDDKTSRASNASKSDNDHDAGPMTTIHNENHRSNLGSEPSAAPTAPVSTAVADDSIESRSTSLSDKFSKERAAAVAPEGSSNAQFQRRGGPAEQMRLIG